MGVTPIAVLKYESHVEIGVFYIKLLLLELILKCSIANVLKYYNIQKQDEMLLDIVPEYHSKITFLNI
jgi:hypothetical protein